MPCWAAPSRTLALPTDLHQLVLADRSGGQVIVDDPRVALVSATGSVRDGPGNRPPRGSPASAAPCSNSAATTQQSSRRRADLDLALRGIVFAAVGTAGQRCTSMRRLIVHESIVDELTDKLVNAYATLRIGDPLG